MKIRDFVLVIILLFVTCGFAFADRQLDRTEVLQIFQTLTSQPKETWIPTGTIEATRQEYKSSNGYIIDSTVLVRYDGDRFYWEINIDSCTRQTQPQRCSRVDFDLNWNKRRVFAWDGERYTMYFRPGNHAIVTEGSSDIPVNVNGPLTAGIVPWGFGIYTIESLSAAESSAIEVDVSGQKQIHLTLKKTNTPEIIFVLDPTKDYAVLSCSLNSAGRSSIVKTCGDYQLVSGTWIPATIIIEQYDDSKQPSELLSYDYWNLDFVSVSLPHYFSVEYETGTLVEYNSSITNKPLLYRYSNEVDTDSLLQNRLAVVLAGNIQTQNCATVAMKYVAGQLGKNVTDQKLVELVNEPNEDTSLYELRRFAKELGFHCLAVKTDIQTLKNLEDCQAILHLPGANHYVVLGHIDDEYVWLVDLDSNKFYYRIRIDQFGLRWREGTALLISRNPLLLTGTFAELKDSELHEIIGSTISFDNFACTELIQGYNVIFCSEMMSGLCGGCYTIFYNRYGCTEGEDGDYCTGTDMIGNIWNPCIEDPHNPGACVGSGDWYSRYIRACK